MDNFQAIGQLVIKAQDLLDSIKGGAIRAMQTQFDALKVQFTDKLSSVSGELSTFVSQQKTSVNTIFSEPDSRYQVLSSASRSFHVGGSVNQWYPVVIELPAVLSRLSITRYSHSDKTRFGQWNGSLALDLLVSSPRYNGGFAGLLIERYGVAGKSGSRVLPDADVPFVGRIGMVRPYQLVVWLRGETTYDISTSNGQDSVDIYDDGVPVAGPGAYMTLNPIDATDGVHVSVPSVGYVRGAV